TEDDVMVATLEAGADDIVVGDGITEVFSGFEDLDRVKTACEAAGFTVDGASAVQVPSNTVKLEGRSAEVMLRLMEALDDHDDCQNVWANFDIDEAALESDE
ncbi:MAG: YebC/PmpR family DNA-binding transcriptional regulator, partial [Deltaproteobacteria bacterium]|nr:YebC/PmpR family DNA-binding transcriptional regulator [Deltaproteobacteria bacterium]